MNLTQLKTLLNSFIKMSNKIQICIYIRNFSSATCYSNDPDKGHIKTVNYLMRIDRKYQKGINELKSSY